MEQFLNRERETPFSKFADKAIQFANKELERLMFTLKEEETIKKFLTTTIARSKLALSSMIESNYTAQLFPDQVNHDYLVYFGL